MLQRGAERRKRDFRCLSVAQKGENRKNHASERFRKGKWSFFMLLNVSEKVKIENKCFCRRHKREKEKIIASVNDISAKKRK